MRVFGLPVPPRAGVAVPHARDRMSSHIHGGGAWGPWKEGTVKCKDLGGSGRTVRMDVDSVPRVFFDLSRDNRVVCACPEACWCMLTCLWTGSTPTHLFCFVLLHIEHAHEQQAYQSCGAARAFC